MKFFNDLSDYLERSNSYLNLSDELIELERETKKLGKIVKEYEKFCKKNEDFITKLHNYYYGLKKYYSAYYENVHISKKLHLTEGDKVRLHSLSRASYIEGRYDKIYSSSEDKPTPANDALNNYLIEKNNPNLNTYCNNIKTMIENSHYAEDSVFSSEDEIIFNHKKNKLEDILDRFTTQEKKVIDLRTKVNKKTLDHVLKYDYKSFYDVKKHLLSTDLDGLRDNIDNIALNSIKDIDTFKYEICRESRKKFNVIVL